jgi:Carboxypeptidase regulatory-like domain/TonB dependent receptor
MRRPSSARVWRALPSLCGVALLALAARAAAQTDVTTSRVSGYTRASDGSALPGVNITATNSETGMTKVAVTDKNGFYYVVNLPTGTYKLEASLSGFASTSREVRLILGSTPSVDFTMEVAGAKESVTVTASVSAIEVTNTAVGTTIQTEQLKNLPLNGRNFTQLVNLTPESKTESQRGYLQISGERGINSNVTVDGGDYNDAFFGGPVGSAEGRAPLSLSEESIKEFSVITNGASVEFGRSGGGFVNVVTKSGTNNVHGSGFFYWQPRDFTLNFAPNAQFPNGRPPADQSKTQYGGSLGGPAIKDQLFFFGSYDKQKQTVTIPISQAVLDQAIFAKYPVLASPDSYVQGRDGWVGFGRADWQITPEHHFMGRVNYARYDGENGTNSSTNDTVQHNGIEGMKSLSVIGTYSAQFGSKILNDLSYNYKKEDIPRADKGLNLPEIQLGTARYGEVSFLPITSTAKRNEVADTLTYLLADHVIKAGGDYNDTSISQDFKGNWRGVFVFTSSPGFTATQNLLAGRYNQYRQFGGLGGLTADEAGTVAFGQKEYAGFIQDQWFVRPKLTVTVGVRYEFLNNPNLPILNQNDVNPNGSFNLNGEIPDAKKQWSPRVSVSFAPDPRTAIRLTAGRYWSRTPAILWAQLFSSNGLRGVQYTSLTNTEGKDPSDPNCKLSTGKSCFDPLAPPWGANWTPIGVERINLSVLPAGTAGLPVFAIDPNFKNPHDDRITLGFEREIVPEVTASLDATYSKGYNLQRLTDANRVYDGTISANGQPHYSSTRPNPFYTTITEYISDAQSKYYSVTLVLEKRFSRNFSANVSAAYSQDRDSDSNERNFSGIQAEDFNHLNTSWNWSDRDQRWRAATNAVWLMPWYGVSLAGSLRFSTGTPYTPRANFDFNGDGQSTTDRPTLGCVAVGATGIDCTNGRHLGRNSFRQPSFYSLDIRLQKAFRIGPGDLNFAVDCFNCTNTGNKFVSQTTFGQVPRRSANGPIVETPQAGFANPNNPGTPFTTQLSVRYDF